MIVYAVMVVRAGYMYCVLIQTINYKSEPFGIDIPN